MGWGENLIVLELIQGLRNNIKDIEPPSIVRNPSATQTKTENNILCQII